MAYGPQGAAEEMARALEALQEVNVPDALRNDMALFLRLVRRVLDEYDHQLRATFDRLLAHAIAANAEGAAPETVDAAHLATAALVDDLPVEEMTLVTRAFGAYFHLANICEEH